MPLYLPSQWQFNLQLPDRRDRRWLVFALLLSYLIMGTTVLGFSRKPMQVIIIMACAAALDILLSGLHKGKVIFPLSGLITSLSLSILLNYTYGYSYLWIPVFVALVSKYVFTFNGRHVYNPAMFAIATTLIFMNDLITLAPTYQWYGSAESWWVMGIFVASAALLLFIFKIDRWVLALSFLVFYTIATAIRAHIMQHIVPFETLFVGSLTSPAFYLFSFYMITDPATSPKPVKMQILVAFLIAALDLWYHKLSSYYTFFFAGITVATIRFAWMHIQAMRSDSQSYTAFWQQHALRLGALVFLVASAFQLSKNQDPQMAAPDFKLTPIAQEHSGLGWAKSNVLKEVDPRVAHVAKWVLSVGDAVACADVNADGLQDVFLTQTLKSTEWQAKLYLNKGDFTFEKVAIPDLEHYLGNPKQYGLPSAALFFDMDNDGDKDLFVGFAMGRSHLFENISAFGKCQFRETPTPVLDADPTVCLAANAADMNMDGYLDIILTNTLPPYMTEYLPEKVPFNLFDLPQPAYPGDRRMFHFMHESWQNANNGGLNFILYNQGGKGFTLDPEVQKQLPQTRWSLAIATSDFNGDQRPDLYIANDFGRDDCYLNLKVNQLAHQQGRFYGEIGLDTYKGMNATAADFDGNGLEDIYVSNVYHAMQAEGSLLWLNHTPQFTEKVQFQERAAQMNVLNIHRFGWGATAADLNLDGYMDIIQTNGMVDAAWDSLYPKRSDYWYYQAQIARTGPEIHSYADKWADIRGRSIYDNEPDCIFLNQKGKLFIDVASQTGFNHLANTRAVAATDFDNDGDLDVLVTDQYGAPKLYRNDQLSMSNWVGVDFGKAQCLGAKLKLTYKLDGIPHTQFREVHALNGFSSQGDERVVFGFGRGVVSEVELCFLSLNLEELLLKPEIGKYISLSYRPIPDATF